MRAFVHSGVWLRDAPRSAKCAPRRMGVSAPRLARACVAHDALRTCARCGKQFRESENTSRSCLFHGDILGNVMQLNWYEGMLRCDLRCIARVRRWGADVARVDVDHHLDDRALDDVKGPRYGRRWACCQDTDSDAPECKSGFHVTFDCPRERWADSVSFRNI